MAKIKSDPVIDSYTAVHWLLPVKEEAHSPQEPLKVIVEVGAGRSMLNVILPDGVSVSVFGNGDMAVFLDPDDELGEHPAVRVEDGKVVPGDAPLSPERAFQHQ